jgi:hypothetical protein
MCEHSTPDPRDAAAVAERALLGLRRLVNELPPGTDIGSDGLGPLLDLIHDRMEPAVNSLQSYVPGNWGPPAA